MLTVTYRDGTSEDVIIIEDAPIPEFDTSELADTFTEAFTTPMGTIRQVKATQYANMIEMSSGSEVSNESDDDSSYRETKRTKR